MVMTKKDCLDFAQFVKVLQENHDKKNSKDKDKDEDKTYENEVKKEKVNEWKIKTTTFYISRTITKKN